ncbi:MAG: ABC transporter substrate-binding protein [Microbacteriaceae bacterium]|nr:ABC transporter substrate-binding protein [Microbacteriaceae bacterium]
MSMSESQNSSKNLRKLVSGVAVVAAGALVLAGCAPAEEETPREELVLKIGTVLPQTGELNFLGPPEEAGVYLAAKEINDANLGIKVEVVYGDSGDPVNNAWATTVPRLLNEKVAALIGAASSGVTKLFLDDAVSAGVITFSPANTSPDFTTWNDNGLYFRTAPSDLLQGEVLGNLIAEDHETLGIIWINDAYGSGLEKVTAATFEAAGGEVVKSVPFNAGDSTFDSQIAEVLAANPSAIALITFNQIYTIGPALDAAGFDLANTYLVDGNLAQFGDEITASFEGAKGTLPGPDTTSDFQNKLKAAWAEYAPTADELKEFAYGAESYDAVILLALAALAANSVAPADIAAKLQEVSGGSGNGTKVTSFAAGAQIILDGGVVDYDGFSGGVKFDAAGDPTEASIGIFQYGADNLYQRIATR